MVRSHHYSNNGHGHTQPRATFCLLVDELPISGSALRVLFSFGGVIQRELDIVKGSQFVVFQDGSAVPVGSDSQLDGL
jgi:hypothetical protein